MKPSIRSVRCIQVANASTVMRDSVHGTPRPPSRSCPPASVKRKRTARVRRVDAGVLGTRLGSASWSSTGRRAPGQLAARAREVLARGADGRDRLVLERAGGRAGRRLDLAAAGQRPGGDHLARVDARLIDRGVGRREQPARVGLLQDVAAAARRSSAPRAARSSSARLNTADCSADSSSLRLRLSRSWRSPRSSARPRAALSPRRAEALLAEAVGDAARAERREAGAQRVATSSSVAAPVSTDLEAVAAQVPEAQLVPVARRRAARGGPASAIASARSGSTPGHAQPLARRARARPSARRSRRRAATTPSAARPARWRRTS